MLDLSCPHCGTDLLAWGEDLRAEELLDGDPVSLACMADVCRVERVEVTLDA